MNSDLSDCDLSGMNLSGCRFSHCRFGRANLDDVVITDALFVSDKSIHEPDRLTVEQLKSTWNYKHGRMVGIRLPDELAALLAKDTEK